MNNGDLAECLFVQVQQGKIAAIALSAYSSQHRTLQDANQTKNRSFVCEENNTPIQL